MDPIKTHLKSDLLSANAMKARKLFVRALIYALIDEISIRTQF